MRAEDAVAGCLFPSSTWPAPEPVLGGWWAIRTLRLKSAVGECITADALVERAFAIE
jgi:hypothetical protein